MIVTGAVVNGLAIIVGGLIGLLLKKGFPEKLKISLMQGLGLCVLYIGISGSLKGENAMIAIVSIVIGTVIGELFDFDKKLRLMGEFFQAKLSSERGQHSFAEGFVNTTLLVCVGAMAIVGSLESGLSGNHAVLFAKALIDGVVALVMASTMGIGVCLAGVSVMLYESIISLTAHGIAGYLTTSTLNEMTCAGSLLIIAIGLNMLKITEIKVANFILVPFIPIFIYMFMG